MSVGDEYRRAASELKTEAATEPDREIAAHVDGLAECFLRLAERADANALDDLWAELRRQQDEGA